jgi:hypothetical protein
LIVWFDLHRQSWFDPHILDPHGDASETTLEATVMFLVQQFQTMNVALAYSQGKTLGESLNFLLQVDTSDRVSLQIV